MNHASICCCLSLLLLPFETIGLLAQNRGIKFERLGEEQELQGTVRCILQDRQGFMWFGVQGGVNKYDGYHITVYQKDVFDSTSLSNGGVSALCEDYAGALWIGTTGGLNRFDRKSEGFTRFALTFENPHSFDNDVIYTIYEDRANALWVGTNHGLYQFDRDHERFISASLTMSALEQLARDDVFSLLEDHAGTFWIGTARGLFKLDPQKGRLLHFMHDENNSRSLGHNVIWQIYEDRYRTLWFGTEGGGLSCLRVDEREAGNFTHFVHDRADAYSLSEDTVWAIREDRFGSLWVGTGNGLNRFEREQERFIRFQQDEKDVNSLSDNWIWSIYEDRSGILWIGTYFGGINKWDRGQTRFTTVAHDPRDPHSLNNNIIDTFYEDRSGALWVGTTGGGVNRLNPASKRFTHFMHDPKNPYTLSNNWVFEINEDRTGALWIGTGDGRVNKFDRKTERFTHPSLEPNHPRRLDHDTVSANYPDTAAQDILWLKIGGGGGLNRLDLAANQLTRFVHDANDSLSLSDNSLWAICAGRSPHLLWVATSNGLNRFDLRTEKFTRYFHDPKNPFSLSNNVVFAILQDRFGALWAGTAQGLNRFDEQSSRFTRYTTKDGLPHNTICGMLEDARGRLWLSTDQGVTCFDPHTEVFRNYDVTDGLPSNGFMAGAAYKNARGEMFFGSFNSGFTRFHPDSIKDNPYIPPVVITSFKRYNTEDAAGVGIVEKGISAKKEIEVSYKDNILSFEFAALSYRNTFKNQYAYKLEGYSDQWIQLGTERRVSFTNLDPGTYTLRVKGSNNDGVWNEEGTSLKITVTPPWWKTRWAYAFYFLLFATILYSWRRYDLNRIHLKNQLRLEHIEAEKLKEVDHLKSRFFANISHEFRTPLTLILGQIDSAISRTIDEPIKNKLNMAFRNARELLRLINQLLDLSKIEAGSMALKARRANFIPFLKNLVFSFESLAEQKGITLQFHTTREDIEIYFEPEKLEKVFYNLLSNAFKFTPEGGKISVQLSVNSDQLPRQQLKTAHCLLVTVKDTGIGIPTEELPRIFDRFYQVDGTHTREHEGTGVGLALAKELVELHHGEITVTSAVGHGTEFVVKLPLGTQHLKTNEIIEQATPLVSESEYLTRPSEELFIPATATATPLSPFAPVETKPATDLVLIVEDNADVRSYIREHLEEHYKILEAANGEEGMAKAQEAIPDLIITDVMMPKIDGYEFSRRLRNDEKTSHIPIIMLTAKASLESKIEGLETGVDDYLTKPFSPKELLARVRNLITLRRQLRERFSRATIIKPSEVSAVSVDRVFLQKVIGVIEANMGEEEFSVEKLAEAVHMSVWQLNRKLNGLIDQPAGQLLRSMRLQRAADLLQQNAGTVAEIAYQVGFGSQAHFATMFQKQFGCTPSEYRKRSA